MKKEYHLTDVILNLPSGTPVNHYWTLDDACKGVQVFGGTGSGKSSGSGKHFAINYLDSGFGGLVMCAKNDEKDQWLRWAKYCGRKDDVIVFSPENNFAFNFLNYEMTRTSQGGGVTFNIVDIFMQLNNLTSGKSGGGGADSFWDDALRELLTNTVDLLKYTDTELTVDNLGSVINSIARDLSQLHVEDEDDENEFSENSFCYQLVEYVTHLVQTDDELEEENRTIDFNARNDIDKLTHYFNDTFPRVDERVQSTILQSFTGIANQLGRGVLRQLYSQETTITPELTLDGKIIILDLSIHSYGAAGRYGQILFKYMWQKAIERRPKDDKKNMRPVFLWVDESQLFMTAYDMIFQTTARSSRACTVYLTQNISNYYAIMPGRNALYSTDSLLGNLNTKVFHANDDFATNNWASKAIGKEITQMRTGGSTIGGQVNNNFNMGFSESLLPILEPNKFRFLATGGELNHFLVEGIVLVTGKSFNNQPFLRAFFKQKSPRR